jgi:hypothetical protein
MLMSWFSPKKAESGYAATGTSASLDLHIQAESGSFLGGAVVLLLAAVSVIHNGCQICRCLSG